MKILTAILAVAAALASGGAMALSGAGNPWETIDEAVCASLIAQDFSVAVGAKTTISKSSRVVANERGPSACMVEATIAPSIGVEIRLPTTGWNQRFLFTGCGGLCGNINSAAGDDAFDRGYAIATTDMGHRSAADDRSWTSDAKLVEDYRHRASHLTVVLAKAVVAAYYGKGPAVSYSRGCSTGGRQGLTSALMYPDDFDGVIAGAPAANYATPHNAWSYLSNLNAAGASVLDVKAIELLRDAVLSSCDNDDGVADGVVGDPPACRFDPRELQCRPGQEAGCLTSSQLGAALRMYDGAKDASGKPYYAMGYARGSEAGWIRSMIGVDGKPPGRAGSAAFFLESVVGKGARAADFDFARHGASGGPLSARLDQGENKTRLAAFADRGGKLLMYHGWSDVDVTPAVSLDFRRDAIAGLGQDKVDDFLRLFFMPGVAHCRGGPGADSVDFLTALEHWVEKGSAPTSLVAAKTSQPGRNYAAFPLKPDTVVFSRTLFPYPAASVFAGKGDSRDASAWVPGR